MTNLLFQLAFGFMLSLIAERLLIDDDADDLDIDDLYQDCGDPVGNHF
jgi:hypothetical protein